MNDPEWMTRVVADSADELEWKRVRSTGLGASDAANFAKPESVEKYARAKMKDGAFRGNSYTRNGHKWEPHALAAIGFQRNTLMFADRENPRFFATPDGIRVGPDGRPVLAEAKTHLLRAFDADGAPLVDLATWEPRIPPTHRRQMAWAQAVLGAVLTEYIVLPCDENHTPLTMTPRVVHYFGDAAEIDTLRVIGADVLAVLDAAAEFERNLHA